MTCLQFYTSTVASDTFLSAKLCVSDSTTPDHCDTYCAYIRIPKSTTTLYKVYASAPLPNSKCGFLCAKSKIVCAKTEFAHANQLRVNDDA